MKKVLSIIMALAMLAMSVSVAVFAEDALGTYTNPYQLTAGSMTPLAVTIDAESDAYVFVDDDNNSTLTIGYATSNNYTVYYCRQPIAPLDDGTMEFTMTEGAEFFNIVNSSDEAVTVYMKLTAGDGTTTYGTVDNPEPLKLEEDMFGYICADAEQSLAAGNEGYYYTVTAPDNGIISVISFAMDSEYNMIDYMFFVNNLTAYKYGDYHYSDDPESVFFEEIKVTKGDELQIFATTYNPNNPWNNPEGIIAVSISFYGDGTWLCPEETTVGAHATTLSANNSGYFYSWIATESGTATVTINSPSNWMYSVDGEMADGSYVYGDYHWYDDDPVVNSESIDVATGDILTIMIATYSPTGVSPAGTVNWTLSFTAGEGPGNGDDDDDIGGGDNDDIGGGEQLEQNYALSDESLTVGTDTYAVSGEYKYTLFAFEPEVTGKYTFSSDNALVGLASTNGMWITAGTSTDAITDGVVTGSAFEWTCTGVGQTIWVAVLADGSSADITVDYEEVEIKEIPREYYENTSTLESFVFSGDADALEYVDTFDGTEDKAVLGSDGYYHLNAADGPILFANLNDTLMSLKTANDYGQLKQIVYGEDGEIVKIIDYTLAMIDYLAYYDADTGLYPLTADLIEIFSKAGESLGWYGEAGWIGGEEADCWMFACYYSEDIKGESDIPAGDDNNGGANNNGTQEGAVAPSTGDNVIVIVAVAVVAVAAIVAVLFIRKRKAN